MEAAVARRELAQPAESDPDSWNTSEAGSEEDEPGAASQQHLPRAPARKAAGDDAGPAGDGEAGDYGMEGGAEDDADTLGDDDEEGDEDGAQPNGAGHGGGDRRVSHAAASGSAVGDNEGRVEGDEQGDPGGPTLLHKGGPAGDNKAASFARAVAKIMESAGGGGRGILSASKSVSKRKREEAAGERTEREAKALKREMRRRGHEVIPKKGEYPEQDAREKALSRLATRGVVRLFNAVAKAQRAQKEAEEGGARGTQASKLSKASFLAELRSQQSAAAAPAQVGQQTMPSKAVAHPAEPRAPESEAGGGWAVLQEGLVGTKGTGTRLKDWDMRSDTSEEGSQLDDDRGGDSDDE